jgi:hypothetical protein
MTLTRWLAASTMLFAATACTADDDPGTGSGTLYVRATVTAVSELPDQRNPDGYISQLRASVWHSEQRELAVESITISSAGGAVELTQDPDGSWWGDQLGYHEVYTLDIDAGENYLAGARVAGPDLHAIDNPTQDGSVPGREDLTVTWSHDQIADHVLVRTINMGATGTEDVGEFLVPAAMLNVDQQGNYDRVHVRRGNSIAPAGAAAESTFSVDIEPHVNFTIEL